MSNATNCGHKGPGRVVGGVEAGPHEFPWHCALLNEAGKFYGCSATLLSCDPVIAVTAAHCVSKIEIPFFTIKFRTPKYLACGKHRLNDADPGELEEDEVRLRISKVVTHPEFNGDTFKSDIAVIKVAESSMSCKQWTVYPACLPSTDQSITYEGWEATTVSGWGRLQEEGERPDTLRKAHIPVVSDTQCRETMSQQSGAPPVLDTMICGGTSTRDSCQGDSGGPLVTTENRRRRSNGGKTGWTLIGVVSWGMGCARPGTYGVYTEVSRYLGWIAQQYGLRSE